MLLYPMSKEQLAAQQAQVDLAEQGREMLRQREADIMAQTLRDEVQAAILHEAVETNRLLRLIGQGLSG